VGAPDCGIDGVDTFVDQLVLANDGALTRMIQRSPPLSQELDVQVPGQAARAIATDPSGSMKSLASVPDASTVTWNQAGTTRTKNLVVAAR